MYNTGIDFAASLGGPARPGGVFDLAVFKTWDQYGWSKDDVVEALAPDALARLRGPDTVMPTADEFEAAHRRLAAQRSQQYPLG